MSQRILISGTLMGDIRSRDEEGMGNIAFNIVIVVDWDIHENAVVKAERASLFRFGEDVPTHIISVGQ